jgi:hypothetical protein
MPDSYVAGNQSRLNNLAVHRIDAFRLFEVNVHRTRFINNNWFDRNGWKRKNSMSLVLKIR